MTLGKLWLTGTALGSLAMLCGLTVAAPAQAAACNWTAAGTTGAFGTAANWSCNFVPGQNDDITINAATGLVVTAGTGSINARTLAVGANNRLDVTGSRNISIYNNRLSLNGTLSLGTGTFDNLGTTNSTLDVDTTDSATGVGTIILSGGTLFNTDAYRVSSRITITGGGRIGNNNAVITNNGTIIATAALTINPRGTSTGISSTGASGIAGTDNAAFFNGGSVIAQNAAVTLSSGRYQNMTSALFAARNGNAFTMATNSALANLSPTGALVGGNYEATGNASTIVLRGTSATSGIVTIGSGASLGTTNTTIILSGTGSVISAGSTSGTATTVDSSLATIAGSGFLRILDGRSFNAGSRALTSNGSIELGGAGLAAGSFTAGSLTNGGKISGHGSISVVINNNVAGTSEVRANGGTLAIRALTGSGNAIADAAATLSLAAATGASGVRTLVNNGALVLGSQNIIVSNDYTNPAFGSGNAFNARANVTGTGAINAASATQTLSAAGLFAGILALPAVRVGGTTQQTLTITNSGTTTVLRGAIQNDSAPGVGIGSPDFVITAGGNATSMISVANAVSGAFSQVIGIVNNFANVGTANVTVKANVYAPAIASLGSNTVNFGAVRVGDAAATSTVSITNTATGALSDDLVTGISSLPSMITALLPGRLAKSGSGVSSFTLASGTAGNFAGTVNLAFTSSNTELADLALGSQGIAYTGKVYAPAVATLGTTTVNFGAARVGDAAVERLLAVTNSTTGALADNLVASIGTLPGQVGGTAPGALAQSASGNAEFTMATNAAGIVSGSGLIGFVSRNSDLADLPLAAQVINFTGKVYATAVATLASSAVNFGVVRQGDAAVVRTVGISNSAFGAPADTLVTSAGGAPAGVTTAAPGALAAGSAGSASFTLATATPGIITGTASLGFSSQNPDLPDLSLASQSVTLAGTVTQLAQSSLFLAGGAGTLIGSGQSWTLDLGKIWYKAGTITTDLGVLNDILASAFAESLGGSFTGGDNGFSLVSGGFAGLSGGASATGNVISFSTTGLSAGLYTSRLYLATTSSFAGLADRDAPQQEILLKVELDVLPEPSVWAQLLIGFGALGVVLRRRVAQGRAA
jgi:hypothetical protein